MPVHCDRSGCLQHASWKPIVVLDPKAQGCATARATLEQNICETHRHILTVVDFVSDEQYAELVRGLRDACSVISDRPRLALEWKRLPVPA